MITIIVLPKLIQSRQISNIFACCYYQWESSKLFWYLIGNNMSLIAGNFRCHITEIKRNSSRISTVTVTDISLISMVLEGKIIWLTTSISLKRYVHWVTDIERFWGLFYIYKMIYCRHLINLNYSSSILLDYTGAHTNINELLRYNQEAHLCPCVPVFNLEPKSTLAIWMYKYYQCNIYIMKDV